MAINKLYRAGILAFLFLLASPAIAQIHLDTSKTVEEIVRQVLLSDQSGLIVKNIKYTGNPNSIAVFQDEDDSGMSLMQEGVILSTGYVFDALGPNKETRTGRKTSANHDKDLQAIATGVVTDAVVLEFDLIALKDSIVFEYVFASEEYPEYVSKGVNDVFGFFIKEVGGRALFPINLAKIPNSNRTVSIDNVNHRSNEEYFLRSDFFEKQSAEFWTAHPEMMLRAYTYEFDGFTVPLKAVLRLQEGKTYHLRLAIADVGDRIVDSAVLLKAKSFAAAGNKVSSADEIVKKNISDKLGKRQSQFSIDDDLSFDLIINFNTNESIIQAESFNVLNELVVLMKEFGDINLQIIGHTDNVGSDAYNLELSKQRARAVKEYLGKQGIVESRITTDGKGEQVAVASNASDSGKAANRRVEFIINY